MASVEEKQIAKEIMLKLIEEGKIMPYPASNDEDTSRNLSLACDAFNQLLNAVSGKD